jgi:glycosyltransferase involved in cell wall biosynthesis
MEYNPQYQYRVLGLSEYSLTQIGHSYVGKHGGLYTALSNDFHVEGVYTPTLKGWSKIVNRALSFQPSLKRWRVTDTMNTRAFRWRTEMVEKYLQDQPGEYDLIVQMLPLFMPGVHYQNQRYVLFTDNTTAISQKHWPTWLPAAKQGEIEQWMELERELYKYAQTVFAFGSHVKQSIIDDYGIPTGQVVSTCLASDIDPPDDHTILTRRYDTRTALFVGYDFERKGGRILLQAWEKVYKEFPDARLIIIGPSRPLGPSIPGVRWMGRLNDHQKLRRHYESASLFVMPSLFEPFGTAYVEAMGMGVPCIAADAFGIRDIIRPWENGVLVPRGEVEPVADALLKFFREPERSHSMGIQAYHDAQEKYTWPKLVESIYPRLLEAVRGK